VYERTAIIERVRRVSPTLQRLDIALDTLHKGIRPGQLFLARTTESLDPYLREPWTPIQADGRNITVERSNLNTYMPGQLVSLVGPVGKPIALREASRTLLLIAHESTPASLLYLAMTALSKNIAVAMVLLGAAQSYPIDVLPQEIEIIRGEGTTWGHQDKTLEWADQIVAVAPPPFDHDFYLALLMTIRKVRIEVVTGYAIGLFQPPMPCGLGACGACYIKQKGGELLACLEGPAFDLSAIEMAGK
jgi:NAD(P)H-flavin reductase